MSQEEVNNSCWACGSHSDNNYGTGRYFCSKECKKMAREASWRMERRQMREEIERIKT